MRNARARRGRRVRYDPAAEHPNKLWPEFKLEERDV